MRWWNLRQNKCPKVECQRPLADKIENNCLICSNPNCKFRIGVDKASKIISDQELRALGGEGQGLSNEESLNEF